VVEHTHLIGVRSRDRIKLLPLALGDKKINEKSFVSTKLVMLSIYVELIIESGLYKH
jgi:hypothetical protein